MLNLKAKHNLPLEGYLNCHNSYINSIKSTRPTMTLSGKEASVQLTDRSRRELWPIKLGYPPPKPNIRKVFLNTRWCWLSTFCAVEEKGRKATRVHEMYYRFQVGTSGPRKLYSQQYKQLLTNWWPQWPLWLCKNSCLSIQYSGNHRTHLRRSVWIVTQVWVSSSRIIN